MLHHLKQFQSQENMTPKLHLLLEHVLPFMRRHKTWAKTSEQGLEALHAIVNRLLNKYRCTRNKEEQMSQVSIRDADGLYNHTLWTSDVENEKKIFRPFHVDILQST
ncbi:hypothetical protein GCK72_009101 [Caenorhabditis remanei]|uniref:Uncharacterized protein n=1 Tax=Caenorhabditis remanei TaxID=31234 RepID=A0A6A5GZ97_CAERE|nr:hypothetical protein GCK72_009101 [Caenorhabditis remanei]KAF1760850.1 hypothetical protein GCK72_009101 [Caenorhabditis remanei]